MRLRSKLVLAILFIVSAWIACLCTLYLQPVDIVAIHKNNEFSSVLVRHFPITDAGKISWWFKNKKMLKDKYDIPSLADDGFFNITFWDYGDGYHVEGKDDRKCFMDSQLPKNCIDKNKLFTVEEAGGKITFSVQDSRYDMNPKGKLIRSAYR